MSGDGHIGAKREVNLIDVTRRNIFGNFGKTLAITRAIKPRHRPTHPSRERVWQELRDMFGFKLVITIKDAEPEQWRRGLAGKARHPGFKRVGSLIGYEPGNRSWFSAKTFKRVNDFAVRPRDNGIDRIAIEPRGRSVDCASVVKEYKWSTRRYHASPFGTNTGLVPVGDVSTLSQTESVRPILLLPTPGFPFDPGTASETARPPIR